MSDRRNIHPIHPTVTRQFREQLLQQRAKLIWFTGLSGSGKSTLAMQLEAELYKLGFKTYLLDGDTIRNGLNQDLVFDESGRKENIRRIAEVCKLFVDAGVVVLATFISPFARDREQVRKIVGAEHYIEVFVDAPLDVCEKRDVKGLYKKARAGEIKDFTGIDSPYEIPKRPDVTIRTDEMAVNKSVDLLVKYVMPKIKR